VLACVILKFAASERRSADDISSSTETMAIE
jgi:hypothetical protein